MKTLIFIISILAFVFPISAQEPCPKVSVIGPSELVPIGENMTFTALIEGIDLNKIEYKWTASGGKIVRGQGTASLIIVTPQEMAGETTLAMVEVSGLPAHCPKTASSSHVICIFPSRARVSQLIDEYSENALFIQKEKLESIKVELLNDLTAKAYIVDKFKRGTSSEFIKRRIENLYRYFYEYSLISSKNINIQIFFTEKNLTQIWIVPENGEEPNKDMQKIEIKGEDYQKRLNELFPVSQKKSRAKKVKKL